MTDSLSTFFALLTALALVVPLTVGVALSGGPARAARLLDPLTPIALWLAACVAVVATAGSLYYSEVANFPPCRYCWFQRIAMYPLSVQLLIAAATRDPRVARYAAPLATGGLVMAGLHIWVQRTPSAGGSCSASAPCAAIWVEVAGFVTIPVMASGGFAAILALLWISRRRFPTPAVPVDPSLPTNPILPVNRSQLPVNRSQPLDPSHSEDLT